MTVQAPSHTAPRTKLNPALALAGIYAVLVSAYVVALLIGKPPLAPGPGNIVQGGDSELYRYAGSHWPWDPQAARVAPLFPWLLTLCLRNIRAVVIVQSMLSIGAWVWLAHAVRRLCANVRLGYAAYLLVLSLSLAPEIIMWNGVVGSEAVSIIALVATLAAFATAVRVRTPRWWLASGLIGALSVFARDTNALAAAAIAAIALVVAIRAPTRVATSLRHRVRVHAVALTLVCIVCVLANNALANQADPPRWYFPVQENILRRVLPNEAFTAWFQRAGLPQIEQLRSVSGDNYFLQHVRLEQGNEFAVFRSWLRANGQATYSRFLIAHPMWSAKSFVVERDFVWLPSVRTYTSVSESTPGALSGLFGAMTFWRSSELILALIGVSFLVLMANALWSSGDRALRLGIGVSLFVGVAHAFASYVADDLEVGRHVLTANVHVRLMVFIVVALAVDRAVTKRPATP